MRGRFVAFVLALALFLTLCVEIAARPWKAAKAADSRLTALAARQRALRHEALVVRRLVRHRWVVYRRQLKRRNAEIASARREHERELAAARAAAAAAAAAAARSSVSRQPSASYAAPAAGASASPRVVTLPPQVTVVSLPPETRTSTS